MTDPRGFYTSDRALGSVPTAGGHGGPPNVVNGRTGSGEITARSRSGCLSQTRTGQSMYSRQVPSSRARRADVRDRREGRRGRDNTTEGRGIGAGPRAPAWIRGGVIHTPAIDDTQAEAGNFLELCYPRERSQLYLRALALIERRNPGLESTRGAVRYPVGAVAKLFVSARRWRG